MNPLKQAYDSEGVGDKISKIMHEGIRRNTHKPVGPGNKRRKVSQKQAVAVAINMKREGKY